MIAPIRQTSDEPAELAGARRAVAEMFLHGKPRRLQTAPVGDSKRTSWMLVAWAAAVTLIYLFRSSR